MLTRRYARSYVRLPVSLTGVSRSGRFEQRGSVLDLSRGGFRVETARSLSTGQVVEVFLRGVAKPCASCRVVWTHTRGAALPSESGLEIQEHFSPNEWGAQSDFLTELRGLYHNPTEPS